MVARPIRQTVPRPQTHLALDRQVRAGCPEEIPHVDPQGRRLAQLQRRIRQRDLEVDALRQEILDQHHLAGKRRRVQIRQDVQPPGAARHIRPQRQGKDMPPCLWIGGQMAAVFHAVGAPQHRRDRQTLQRPRLAVAGQGGGKDRLAHAVGAPVGGQKDVDGRRGRMPFHAPVRQVEGGIGQRQKGDVLRPPPRHQQRRCRSPCAPRQPRREPCEPRAVGHRLAQHGIGPADQAEPDARNGGGVRQGTHRDLHAVHPRPCGQPEIGQHEPLRCRRVVIGIAPRHRGGKHVDARRLPFERFRHRQARGHVGVEVVAHLSLPAPDLLREIGGELFVLVGRQGPSEIAFADRPDEVAIADAPQAQVQHIGVHRLHWQGGLRAARQDKGAARETDRRAAVAHVKLQGDIPVQRLATRRRETRTQGHGVALPVFHAVDAQLPVGGLDRQSAPLDPDEGVIVRSRLHQRFRELRADARRGGIAFDPVFHDAEAVFADGLVQRRRDIVARGGGLRQPQGGNGLTAPPLGLQGARQDAQRLDLRGGLTGAQVAVCRRQHRLAAQVVLPVTGFAVARGQRKARVIGPEIGTVGKRHGLARPAQRLRGVSRLLGGAHGVCQALQRLPVEGIAHRVAGNEIPRGLQIRCGQER